MNKNSRLYNVASPIWLTCTSFLLLIASVPSPALAESLKSSLTQSITPPVPDDYLLYNATHEGSWSYVNLTFIEYVSLDLVNVSLTLFGESKYHFILNTHDSFIFFINIENVSVGTTIKICMGPWLDTQGIVIGEKTFALGRNTYPCWQVKANIIGYNFDFHYEKLSGILIFMNVTQSGSAMGTMELLEGKLGNYNVIPEFSQLIVLPLFMMATLLTAIVCRRRRSDG